MSKLPSHVDVTTRDNLRLTFGQLAFTFYHKGTGRVALREATRSIEDLVHAVVGYVTVEVHQRGSCNSAIKEALEFLFSPETDVLGSLSYQVVTSMKTTEQLALLQSLDWNGVEMKTITNFLTQQGVVPYSQTLKIVASAQDRILGIVVRLHKSEWRASMERARQQESARQEAERATKIKEARQFLELEGFEVKSLSAVRSAVLEFSKEVTRR